MRRMSPNKKSIKQMIKNHRQRQQAKNAQITRVQCQKPKGHFRTLSKLGVGGGFREPWSDRTLGKLKMITPQSIRQLQNIEHMDIDEFINRKGSMFDFQTML